MNQIIQIVKEKISDNLSVLKTGDAKNAPRLSPNIFTVDLIGLAWIFRDEYTLEDLK
jgi:hypothetical protein